MGQEHEREEKKRPSSDVGMLQRGFHDLNLRQNLSGELLKAPGATRVLGENQPTSVPTTFSVILKYSSMVGKRSKSSRLIQDKRSLDLQAAHNITHATLESKNHKSRKEPVNLFGIKKD
jgi:hypothetical protein